MTSTRAPEPVDVSFHNLVEAINNLANVQEIAYLLPIVSVYTQQVKKDANRKNEKLEELEERVAHMCATWADNEKMKNIEEEFCKKIKSAQKELTNARKEARASEGQMAMTKDRDDFIRQFTKLADSCRTFFWRRRYLGFGFRVVISNKTITLAFASKYLSITRRKYLQYASSDCAAAGVSWPRVGQRKRPALQTRAIRLFTWVRKRKVKLEGEPSPLCLHIVKSR